MTMDFVAIDWETANAHRASPCAIGMVVIRDGDVAESWSTLMRPPRGHGSFSPRNTAIHGLGADDVVGAPRFDEVWPEIERRLVGLPVFAHNAAFDMSVIQETTAAVGLPCPELTFGCTLVLARQHYVLRSYTLDQWPGRLTSRSATTTKRSQTPWRQQESWPPSPARPTSATSKTSSTCTGSPGVSSTPPDSPDAALTAPQLGLARADATSEIRSHRPGRCRPPCGEREPHGVTDHVTSQAAEEHERAHA